MIQYHEKYTGTHWWVISFDSVDNLKTSTSGQTETNVDEFAPEQGDRDAFIEQKTTQERIGEDVDDTEDDRSKPLTLSQLSPRKQQGTQDAVKRSGTDLSAPSPTRTATKRPMTTPSTSEEPKLKRSKGDKPETTERLMKPTVSKGRLVSKPRIPSSRTQPQSRKPSATLSGLGSSSSLKPSSNVAAIAPKPAGLRRTKSRIVSASTQTSVFNPSTGWNDDVRVSEEKDTRRSNSSLRVSGPSLQSSRIQNEGKHDGKAPISSSSSRCTEIQGAPEPPKATLEDSDSRSTSRSQSTSQSYKHKFYHPAPNFKAIHAAFDASLSHRKENIHPTVPLAMRWETESRLQERKKFEERLREKEREKEKEDEEMRRLREAEEERELKELRKKMVVKAHDVPEWYNARPKMKKKQEQDAEN